MDVDMRRSRGFILRNWLVIVGTGKSEVPASWWAGITDWS